MGFWDDYVDAVGGWVDRNPSTVISEQVARIKSGDTTATALKPEEMIAADKENEAISFNEQCFLFEHIDKYSKFRKSLGGFNEFTAINGEPSELVNAITGRPGVEELLQLTNVYKALLVPKIKLLKVIHKDGAGCKSVEIPIPFKQHYTLEDIDSITETRRGRGSGIGIKNVDLIFDGKDPVQAKVFIDCNMSFYFHNMKDLTERFTTTIDNDEYEVGPIDLILPLKVEKAQKEGGRLDFKDFQIQLILGWSILEDPDPNMSLSLPNELVRLIKDNTSLKLWLQLKRHKLDFNQDGSFVLNVEYIAAIAGIMNNPSTNVLVVNEEILYNMGPTIKTKHGYGKVSKQSREMTKRNTDTLEAREKLLQKAIKKQTKLEEQGRATGGKLESFGWKSDYNTLANTGFFKKIKEALERKEGMPKLPSPSKMSDLLATVRAELAEVRSMRRGAKYQTFINMLLGGCERRSDDYEQYTFGGPKDKRKFSTCVPRIFVEKIPKQLVGIFTDKSMRGYSGGALGKMVASDVVASKGKMKNQRAGIAHKLKSEKVDVTAQSGANAKSKDMQDVQRDIEVKMRSAIEKRAKKQAGSSGDEDAGKLGNNMIDALGDVLKGEVDEDGTYRFYYMFFGDILDVMFRAAFAGTDRYCNDLSKIKVLVGPFAKGGKISDPHGPIINLADVPISLSLFMNWFMETIVKKNLDTYLLATAIRDMVSMLLTPALGDGCFKGTDSNVSVKMGMYLGPAGAKGGDRLTQVLNKFGRVNLNIGGAKKLLNVPQHPEGEMTNYFLIYASTYDTQNLDGDPEADAKKGIYHFYMGAESGLVKNFAFARDEIKGSAEANIIEQGMVTPEKGLGDSVYNADVDMIGNFLFVPGQMIFINPSIIGLGNASSANSYAFKLRIGGYYLVTKVVNKINMQNFDTRLTCRWVGYHPGKATTRPIDKAEADAGKTKKSLDKPK